MIATYKSRPLSPYSPISPYKPEEWQLAAFADMSLTMLLTGSAGGGKSKTAYEKIHALALMYPGATIVAARKIREDALVSIKPALENSVIGDDPTVRWHEKRFSFVYDNGSVIYIRGVKDEKARIGLRSIGNNGAIDFFLMEEGIEFDEDDYNEILGRMRGTVAPWVQIIICTNPGPPLHWINRRLIIGGEASVHYSSASDNPYNPDHYLETLKRMTGVQGQRLRDGLWALGTGRVVDTWLDDYAPNRTRIVGNVTTDAGFVIGGGPTILMADDGYAGEYDARAGMFKAGSHPRTFLLGQLRSDGRICAFDEIYQVKTRAEDQIADLLRAFEDYGAPRPRIAYYDKSAASLRGDLERAGFTQFYYPTVPVAESLKTLVYEVGPDKNNWRRIMVHPRCRMLRMEFATYSYGREGNIIKDFDHGPDAVRYQIYPYIHGAGKPVTIAATGSKLNVPDVMANVTSAVEKARAKVEESINASRLKQDN